MLDLIAFARARPRAWPLRRIEPGAGTEFQLTYTIASLLQERAVLAHQLKAVRCDRGSKLGYLQATMESGLKHPEVGEAFAAYLEARGQTLQPAPKAF